MHVSTEGKQEDRLSHLSFQVVGDLLYVLADRVHERLLQNFLLSPQTAIAESIELFSVREASLNRLVS